MSKKDLIQRKNERRYKILHKVFHFLVFLYLKWDYLNTRIH